MGSLRDRMPNVPADFPEYGTEHRVWTVFQFLESTDVLRQYAAEDVGFQMSLEQALDISSCLFQAREYYRSAREADLVIKPLLIYYGMSNLAKATTMLFGGKERSALHRLPAAHGLEFAFEFGSPVEEAACKLSKTGTFQDFNDTIAQSMVIEEGGITLRVVNTLSCDLVGARLSLLELWSCVPSLEIGYHVTFDSYCSALQANVQSFGKHEYHFVLAHRRLSKERLERLRQHFSEVGIPRRHFPQTIILDPARIDRIPGTWVSLDRQGGLLAGEFLLEGSCVPPLSPLSVQLLGMYVLGMIARYRPGTWTGFTRLGKQDRALAYVNEFVDYCEEAFPSELIRQMDRIT